MTSFSDVYHCYVVDEENVCVTDIGRIKHQLESSLRHAINERNINKTESYQLRITAGSEVSSADKVGDVAGDGIRLRVQRNIANAFFAAVAKSLEVGEALYVRKSYGATTHVYYSVSMSTLMSIDKSSDGKEDEECDGKMVKDPDQKETIVPFVNCISRQEEPVLYMGFKHNVANGSSSQQNPISHMDLLLVKNTLMDNNQVSWRLGMDATNICKVTQKTVLHHHEKCGTLRYYTRESQNENRNNILDSYEIGVELCDLERCLENIDDTAQFLGVFSNLLLCWGNLQQVSMEHSFCIIQENVKDDNEEE